MEPLSGEPLEVWWRRTTSLVCCTSEGARAGSHVASPAGSGGLFATRPYSALRGREHRVL